MSESNGRGKNQASDPWVVRAADLKPYVDEFIEIYNIKHPNGMQDRGRRNRSTPSFGALTYLVCKMEDNMDLSTDEKKNSMYMGLIRRVRDGRTKYVGYGNADILCTAMGRPDILRAIEILVNPSISKRRREELLNGQP